MTNLNFKSLSNQDLLLKMKSLSSEDRNLQVLFLKHLKEVEMRKLFLEIGYSSLFEYVVQELGYSESTAYRRIEAARLLKDLPEIEDKLKSGAISLNTAAQVQTYFKKIKRKQVSVTSQTDLAFTHEFHDMNKNKKKSENITMSKADLVSQLENKSTREVEKHLLSLMPENILPQEKLRLISDERTELKLILNNVQKKRLDQLKLILSHVNPNMSYQQLIDHLCERALKQLDPSSKKQKTQVTSKISSTRYLPTLLKSKIHQRDQSCCTYVNPETKKQCGSQFQLQIDHIQPYALGGKNEESNLRLLCASHNRFRAEKTFGKYKS